VTEPFWITRPEVVAIHDLQLAEHGGPVGLRDLNLLESALARPQQILAYGNRDIFALAAAYTGGIIRNHPFADGNKRTGFITGILFLEFNDYRFTASEPAATQAVFALASGDMSEEDFAAWLRDNSRR
jgi:death-on-curing protein